MIPTGWPAQALLRSNSSWDGFSEYPFCVLLCLIFTSTFVQILYTHPVSFTHLRFLFLGDCDRLAGPVISNLSPSTSKLSLLETLDSSSPQRLPSYPQRPLHLFPVTSRSILHIAVAGIVVDIAAFVSPGLLHSISCCDFGSSTSSSVPVIWCNGVWRIEPRRRGEGNNPHMNSNN